MKVKDLVAGYYKGYSGTEKKQVLSVTLIDSVDGVILFEEMRAEAFLKLVSPELEVDEWYVKMGQSYPIRFREEPRESVILIIHAAVMTDVPDYYSEEEWEMIMNNRRPEEAPRREEDEV